MCSRGSPPIDLSCRVSKAIEMNFASRFRQGMKAAIPVWIAFVPSSLAWGISAQSHKLTVEEVFLMSAWSIPGRRSLLF
jgi:predicted branched-subunit amino acid permease